MSTAASGAAAFYREVAASRVLWTIRDDGGFPAPMNAEGLRAQPFWSSRARAEKVIARVAAYAGFRVIEIAWDTFVTRWVPGLTADNILIGVNWSGPRATGFDVAATEVVRNVERASA